MTVLYANTATYLPGLLTSGLYSSVANCYGRRVVMNISLFGLVIYAFLFAYVVVVGPSKYLEIIIIASFFLGITGTYASFMMGAFSFVADTTDPSCRTRAYSITESCLYIGKIAGPLVSGFWAQSFGFQIPFIATAVGAGLCICYITFFVQESLCLMRERQLMTKSVGVRGDTEYTNGGILSFNPLQTYHNLKIILSHEGQGRESPIPYIAVAFFFFHVSLMGFMQIVYVYMKHKYNWSSLLIGFYDSINGTIQVYSFKYLQTCLANRCLLGCVNAFCALTCSQDIAAQARSEYMDNDGI